MGKVALFGATGAIGSSMAAALRAAGREYRVVGRSRSSLEREFGGDPLAEIVTWNPGDPDSVRAAATGIETIVYLVGVPYTDFAQHPVVVKQTLDGAIAAGVSNMLLIGTVYPYGMPQTTPLREDHPRNPHTFKGKMRKAQEDLLLDADAAGRIHGAVLRLPDFYGPNVAGSFMRSTFQAAASGGKAQLIGPIDTPHEFVFVPDVGPVVVRLIDRPAAWGHVWHFGGAGTITQRDFALRVFSQAGRKPRFMVVNKFMLRAIGVFVPLVRELVEMNYLQTNPVIMNDDALRALLGEVHKTSYDEGIRQSLAAYSASAAVA
ncbi:MAG: NAD-dependent epimerase/dehydratase family protein [Vulcanimicrobiaceae bacterium]